MATAAEQLSNISAKLDQVLAAVSALSTGVVGTGGVSASPDTDPSSITGDRGDPEIRFNPKKFVEGGGRNYKGLRMSQMTPAELDDAAGVYEFFARKNDENEQLDNKGGPKSKWDRLDATRARTWAAKRRSEAGPEL
jgi:hypothetical protein